MSANTILILTSEKKSHSCYCAMKFNGSSIQTSPLCDYIDSIEFHRPSVILLDCGFDPESGLDYLREVKLSYPSVPVIFITGVTAEEIAVEAFRCGARDYLKKPLNILELQNSIQCILMIKKSPREQRRSCLMNIYYQKVETESLETDLMPANIGSVMRYIEMNLTEQISLDQLAVEAHSSKYHFCKIFKKYTGVSPLRYVAFMRVKKAKELLRHSDLNISEVAWEVGFNDLSNFNKHFKKCTGITPTLYKLTEQGDAEKKNKSRHLPDFVKTLTAQHR